MEKGDCTTDELRSVDMLLFLFVFVRVRLLWHESIPEMTSEQTARRSINSERNSGAVPGPPRRGLEKQKQPHTVQEGYDLSLVRPCKEGRVNPLGDDQTGP